ncbi:SdiA-regulated domain-containing protein [Halopseudomonas xiamenensis]|uniref:SdiA-regulated domain-containing protein n=1 Tax=Halopseudomonas xiamenensis TaxID=157792 RepID=UPI001624C1E3|nr:SdiA-regulated domain-containing protein [Halopseudomonas xiamenensis]
MKRYLLPAALVLLLLVAGGTLHYLHLDVLLWQNWKLNRQPMPAQAFNLGRYRVDIEALPIPELDDDLSALTYNSDSDTLFGLLNGEPLIVELSLDGQLLRRIWVEGVSDMEGLTHIGGNRYVIAEEHRHRLLQIEIAPDAVELDVSGAPSLTIDLGGDDNKSLEGLSWDEQHQRLLVVKERDPLQALVVTGFANQDSGASAISISLEPTLSPDRLFMRDLSSLTLDSQTRHLLLLSDQSHMVVEYGADGTPLSLLGLWRGMSGLRRTIPQAEGLAIDSQRRVYVVSEPNLFYRFIPAKE